MIVGIGTDIVKIGRIKKIIDSPKKEAFLKKLFSKEEIEYSEKKKDPHIHFAGFFAAKESLIKALTLEKGEGLKLSEIYILHNKYGAPTINFKGKTKDTIQNFNINNFLVSISHEKEYAVSFVILQR